MKIKHSKEMIMFLVFAIVAISFLTYPFKFTGMAAECPEGQVAEADGTCVETVKEAPQAPELADGIIIIDEKEFYRHETGGKEEYVPMNKIRANEKGAFLVTAKNIGNAPVKLGFVELTVRGGGTAKINAGSLAPGESRKVRIPISPLAPGKYRMTISYNTQQREPELHDNTQEVNIEVIDSTGTLAKPAEVEQAEAGIDFFGIEQDGREISLNQVEVGKPFKFKFRVRNTGKMPYNAMVKLYADVSEMRRANLGTIQPGEEKIGTIELAYTLNEPKQYIFFLRLDKYYNEENLKNNEVKIPITTIKTEAAMPVQPTPEPQPQPTEKIIDFEVIAQQNNVILLTKDSKYADLTNMPANEPFFVVFDIKNTGEEKLQPKYAVLLDDFEVEKVVERMIAPSGRLKIQQPFSGLPPGQHKLGVGVKPQQGELNIKDNTKYFDIKVAVPKEEPKPEPAPVSQVPKYDFSISSVQLIQYDASLGREAASFSWGPSGILVSPEKDVKLYINVPAGLPATGVDVYVDNKKVKNIPAPYYSDKYSDTQRLTINLEKLSSGKHTIKAVINPTGAIDETNKGNNIFEKDLWVKAQKGIVDIAVDEIELYYVGDETNAVNPNYVKELKSMKGTVWFRNIGAETIEKTTITTKVRDSSGKAVYEQTSDITNVNSGGKAGTGIRFMSPSEGKYTIYIEIKPAEGETKIDDNKKIIPLNVYKEKNNILIAPDSKAIFNDAEAKKRKKNFISLYIHLINQGYKEISPIVNIYYGSQKTSIPTARFKNDHWAKSEITVDRNAFPKYVIATIDVDDDNKIDNIVMMPVTIMKDGKTFQI